MTNLIDTVLVTGGCGFLGSHIVDALIAEGRFRVVAVSRNPTRYRNPQAEYLRCDTTNRDDIAALIERVNPCTIIHTATPGPDAPSSLHHKELVSLGYMIELAAKNTATKAFIYSSSSMVVANASGSSPEPLSEIEAILYTPKTAPTTYARCKSLSDQLVLQKNGPELSTAVLRLPAIYGPRDMSTSLKILGMAGTFMVKIQFGDNKVVHDWVYVESAAHAHILANNALLTPRGDPQAAAAGQAFFITDGVPMKHWDFMREVWSAAGDKRSSQNEGITVIPWWIVLVLAGMCEFITFLCTFGRGTPPFTRLQVKYVREGAWFNVESARARLGYVPLVDTKDGIRKTVAWHRGVQKAD